MARGVIAVVNMKGGVGKTTTVIALAETLAAADNAPVLVVDLDTQASASCCLAGDQKLTQLIEEGRTIDRYFESSLIHNKPLHIQDIICQNASSVTHGEQTTLPISLLASSIHLRLTEREILYRLTKKGYSMTAIEGRALTKLRSDIGDLSANFRYIIFDCAPGISAFTAAAVSLADLIIVPTIPDFLSTYGMQSFVRRVFPELREGGNSRRHKPYILITRKKNTVNHKKYHSLISDFSKKKQSEFRVFDTVIPDNDSLSKAPTVHYGTYAQKYPIPIGALLESLAIEVKGALS